MISSPRAMRCDNWARGCPGGPTDLGPELTTNLTPGSPAFILGSAGRRPEPRAQTDPGRGPRGPTGDAARPIRSGFGARRHRQSTRAFQQSRHRPCFLRARAAPACRLGHGRLRARRLPPARASRWKGWSGQEARPRAIQLTGYPGTRKFAPTRRVRPATITRWRGRRRIADSRDSARPLRPSVSRLNPRGHHGGHREVDPLAEAARV